jgi:DNA-binding IclR family transcriptional regulator
VEDGEVTPGLASVGAAVHDHTGRPVAGAAVTFDAADTDGAARAALAREVRAAAAELTRRIRGRAPDRRG